jgi:tetratricopeptide (TPR) repeat protein
MTLGPGSQSNFAWVKSSSLTVLIGIGLNGSLLAQAPDQFQPDIPAPLVAKVNHARDTKDPVAAEAELQDVIKQRPDYYRALSNLGYVYQLQGKPEQALETLKKAKSLRDTLHIADSNILNSIGWAYMNSGRVKEAEQAFLDGLNEAPQSDPTDTEHILNNLGYLYLQKGDTTRARFYLEKAVNDYNSSSGRKLLASADDYDRRKPAKNFRNSLGRMMMWIPSLRIWVCETEVTQKEFMSLMGSNPSQNKGSIDLPVDSVTAPEAMDFCGRLTKKEISKRQLQPGYSYTLPTDSQWSVYVDNANLRDAVTSESEPRYGPEKVKTLLPNEFGLYDTRGNVWEWTQTPYSDDLNFPDIRARYKRLDPHGQVLRGGSWSSQGDLLKTTTRSSNSPTLRDPTNGFRIILVPPQ